MNIIILILDGILTPNTDTGMTHWHTHSETSCGEIERTRQSAYVYNESYDFQVSSALHELTPAVCSVSVHDRCAVSASVQSQLVCIVNRVCMRRISALSQIGYLASMD